MPQTVLRGDARVDRNSIDGFTIATIPSTSDRAVKISNLRLNVNEPEFKRKRQVYIDRMGQMVGREWSWKTADEQELASRLQAERRSGAGEGAAEECETGGNTALIGIRSGIQAQGSSRTLEGFGFGKYGGWRGKHSSRPGISARPTMARIGGSSTLTASHCSVPGWTASARLRQCELREWNICPNCPHRRKDTEMHGRAGNGFQLRGCQSDSCIRCGLASGLGVAHRVSAAALWLQHDWQLVR